MTGSVGLSPEPGLYRYRYGKACPWVPVRIDLVQACDPETGEPMDRALRLRCLIAGEEAAPLDVWPLFPIARAEYDRLLREMPDDPRLPVDLAEPPFEVTDWLFLDLAALLPYLDRRAIVWAIEAWARNTKPRQRQLRGVRFNIQED